MIARTNLKLKQRKSVTLSGFRGVDYSSAPTDVAPFRASEMENFINEYGVPHKRHGWREVARIRTYDSISNTYTDISVNGIFEIAENKYLVHYGVGFYYLKNEDGDYSLKAAALQMNSGDAANISNTRSQAFKNGTKLYIIGCGDYLTAEYDSTQDNINIARVYGSADTYIPTTTIMIENDTVAEQNVAFLDDINILSPLIKNTLIGSAELNKSWTLDAEKIKAGTKVYFKASVLEEIDGVETVVEYEGENGATYSDNLYYTRKNGGTAIAVIDAPTENKFGELTRANGKIKFTRNTMTPTGSANIEITFNPDYEDKSERVTKASFGTLFGVSGRSDRLFVSGNNEFCNLDFYSEARDYSYFGENNTAAFGSDSNPVTGFLRLADSTLAVFKKYSAQEATVYFVTGTDRTNEGGDITAVFTVSAGGIGEGCLNARCCADLRGDTLMLSDNGIFGIAQKSELTSEKYALSRSRLINARLKRQPGLSEAAATVFNGKYYLAVDGVCYVADSEYTYRADDGNINYEWWYWTNIPARVWGNMTGILSFGTADGRICVFDDEYSDRTRQDILPGMLTLTQSSGKYSFDRALNIKDGDEIVITSANMYCSLCTVRHDWDQDDNVFYYGEYFSDTETAQTRVYEGVEGYFLFFDFQGLTRYRKYKLLNIDRGEKTLQLLDTVTGEFAEETSETSTRSNTLCRLITGEKMHIVNTDTTGENGEFKISFTENGDPVAYESSWYFTPPETLLGYIISIAPVRAIRYTPVMDLGTNETSKTLLGMTLCAKAEKNGRISFGYETRRAQRNTYSSRGVGELNFDSTDFNDFSFETGFASSYSVRCNERNFNFIRFRMVSADSGDCAISELTVNYKYNKNNWGVN